MNAWAVPFLEVVFGRAWATVGPVMLPKDNLTVYQEACAHSVPSGHLPNLNAERQLPFH